MTPPEPALSPSDELEEKPKLLLNPTLKAGLTLVWEVRGHGQQTMEINSQTDPELVRFVVRSLLLNGTPANEVPRSAKVATLLRSQRLLVTPDEVPREVSLELAIPNLDLSEQDGQSELELADVTLSTHLYLQEGDELPEPLKDRLTRRTMVPRGRPVLFVDEPATGVLAMYTLDSEAGAVALALVRGIEHVQASSSILRVLVKAGILKLRNERAPLPMERELRAEQLLTEGYVVLRQVINPVQLSLYQKYVVALREEGRLFFDVQVHDARRASAHREPLCEFLHEQLTALVNSIVPHPVKPSYSFLGVYEPGAQLVKHRDRPQCRWNVSLVLDSEPQAALPWPFWIEHEGKANAITLYPGDAVLYCGTDSWHWRDTQPEHQRTTATFLHFVPVGFEGKLD